MIMSFKFFRVHTALSDGIRMEQVNASQPGSLFAAAQIYCHELHILELETGLYAEKSCGLIP